MKGGIVVIKLSGKVLGDPALLASACGDLLFLQEAGVKPVVVHGGGRQIDLEAAKHGLGKKRVNGLRYTDACMLEVVEQVLTRLNKALVAGLRAQGAQAIGLNVGQRFLVNARKKPGLGFVGEVSSVDGDKLLGLLSSSVIPVVSCLARGKHTRLNVNADDVAVAVAAAVEAERLVFVSDVPGILGEDGNRASLLPVVSVQTAKALIKQGMVSDGMVPKVLACLKATDSNLEWIQVMGAENHSIRKSLRSSTPIGTRITK